MEQKDPDKLFEKYKTGTLSDAEKMMLESWYLQLSKERNVHLEEGDLPNVDVFWKRWSENREKNLPVESHLNGTTSLRRWLVAASLAMMCAFAGLYYYTDGNVFTNGAISQKVYAHATAHETRMLRLPDGTVVWLNAASTLTYPGQFNISERTVELQGEAYFEVAHDAQRPFIIRSGEFETQVLGTSFNVSAYPEESSFEVAVLTGRVAVSSKPGHETDTQEFSAVLSARQRIRYNHLSHELQSYEDDHIEDVIAWRQGRIIYRHASLSEVLPDLERKYAVRLTANPEILGCSIFLRLENEPLEKVLKVLAELVDGKIIKKGDAYHLVGKPCNKK
ncbi:MAG TPA: FecR domain-containing protein [Chryseosolibacter sp.]|nr:FecR domain-containing protein [Chryseosolibacter sp.]